ncbi:MULTISPECIES: response regulator [Cellulophaga]|jgi:CheY-like chemotaxis protein|uniref:Response regulator receiver domain-containing protein n=2 Tax=Cellulophaga baltica TaxID=76594 RepID=A0A1G7EF61_9FLAO|nr:MULTISPECIES: response regulator [Cellulophaga]AIZ40216.1 transcriptional regulator [Cellulophaga baltica 18]KGK29330.1 transcriptional regulator [Cellulophaga sp. E6(2014)]MBA6314356.1 response regulator [Cellulophaga baltica]MCR1024494.1 response regulator [Cellulophaga baltica]SDE62237.1 Response regulator receiver domain-containing protein [Cellulophaga baltica]
MKIDTVCIIDDDPIFVYGTKVILNSNGKFCSTITVFENGQEALDDLEALLKSNQELPEVIFLDLNMPIMDGWDFLDEFCKIPDIESKTRVYILSSSIFSGDIEKSKEYSIVKDFISKPLTDIKFEHLLKEIENERIGRTA